MKLLSRLPSLTVKDAIAAFLVAIAAVFLIIDSNILARGAARWADNSLDRFSYGLIAFLVPWVVAVTPFVVIALWRAKHRMWAIVSSMLWVVFVSYNLIGAGGAIAMIRADVISIRRQEVTVHTGDVSRRENLQRQLDDIPKGTRQPGQVAALIEKEKASPWWQHSAQCKDASNPKERKFCGALAQLQGELAAAKAMIELTAQIAAVDGKIQAGGPAATMVDPVAAFVAGWTGTSEGQAQNLLPLATPAVLLLGSVFLLAIALALKDMGHGALTDRALVGMGAVGKTRLDSSSSASRGKPLQVVARSANDVVMTRQRDLAVWFFRECATPITSGSMPESAWYQHYRDFCRSTNDTPMTVPSFREIAKTVSFISIEDVAGEVFYFGALPLVPTKVATAS